jgi:hypothetical protein
LLLKGAGENKRLVRNESDERGFSKRTVRKIGAKGLEIPALVTPLTDRTGSRENIATNSSPRQITTEVLEFVMSISCRELLQAKSNLRGYLINRCHKSLIGFERETASRQVFYSLNFEFKTPRTSPSRIR